ncbi:hypothetical protein [Bradyrhizobium sp. LHD-71]|nr:hypothetical protein [Bradyrhizobium sp. LHD-71]MDQ8730095.1 hypothetical protein [Bradyrhizobium sp. LHD-71]
MDDGRCVCILLNVRGASVDALFRAADKVKGRSFEFQNFARVEGGEVA